MLLPSLLLHILSLTSVTLSFRYLFSHTTKLTHSFGGPFQQLTILCLLFSTLAFAHGLLVDITRSSPLNRIRNGLLSFITPMELLLAITYWPLLAYDPALIIDTRTAGNLPLLADMGFHLFPAIFLLFDSILAPPVVISKLRALGVCAAIVGCYWVWIVLCERRNGFWVYPIIGKMGGTERAAALMAWVGALWGVWWLVEECKRSVGSGGDVRLVVGRKRK